MEFGVWAAFFLMFLAGGLTPGPAVMLVTTSSIRYGFWASLAPATGICVGNVIWVFLAASGVSTLAHAFPAAFLALKVIGIAFILYLAWKTAFGEPVDLLRREPPPKARLLAHGVGLQLANPNALVYFGGLMPAYIDAEKDLVMQVTILLITVTLTEMFGLVTYALGADALAKRFQSKTFAHWFFRIAALTMAASASFAVYSTWGR
jgi:threonine/homoserine/homoserine lactone efflux protein